jgi:hypothetical protein
MITFKKDINYEELLQNDKGYTSVKIADPQELISKKFSEEGLTALSKVTKIPTAYVKKMYRTDRGLFNTNVDFWFKKNDLPNFFNVVVRDGDDTVIGFPNENVQLMTMDAIIGRLTDLFDENNWEAEIVSLMVSPFDSFVSVIFKDLVIDAGNGHVQGDGEPKVGDLLNAGFSLSHSTIGANHDKLASYVHRLVCDNGTQVEDARYSFKKALGQDYSNYGDYYTILNDFVVQSRETSRQAMEKFVSLKNIPVPDPITAVNSLAQIMKLKDEDVLLIVQQLDTTEVENMYDLMNLFTMFSSRQPDPYTMRKLQTKTGEFLLSDVCGECHQIVKVKVNNN